jgi:retinol dehydrogenase-12
VLNSVGGNAGVGKETVKVRWTLYPVNSGLIGPHRQQLLTHNATVYLAARSAQKANEAIEELKTETGKQAIFLQLDLSDLHAVRKSAQEFLSYVFVCCVSTSRCEICDLFSGKRTICMS